MDSITIRINPTKKGISYFKGKQYASVEVLERYEKIAFRSTKQLDPDLILKIKERWKHKQVEFL